MKKTLPAADIANELSGSSVFFEPRMTPEVIDPQSPAAKTGPAPVQQPDFLQAANAVTRDTNPSSNHDVVIPRNGDTKTSSRPPLVEVPVPPSMKPFVNNNVTPDMLEAVRRVVKQLGKEAATHRFSMEEKRAIADLVYTYTRQGVRTSENEITRIAINWLLSDFKESGEQSVLARMLALLHG